MWFGQGRFSPHYARAASELGVVLAIGEAYYWIVSDVNRPDWDFPDWQTRMSYLEVRFDNNMFRTNHLLHPLAGTMSYWLARSNGLDIYWSSLYSASSSAVFEFLLEWLEKASINDLIVTPAGGIAAGEFFFHLGDYLNSAVGHETAVQRSLAFTLGLPQAMHRPLDGVHGVPFGTQDDLGYSSAYWHRFVLGYGVAGVSNELARNDLVQDLFAEAELVAMPGFLRPGRFSVDFDQGNFTGAYLRASMSRGFLRDVDLKFDANLVGTYAQDFEGSSADLRGTASMVAASMNMRYVDRWLLGRRDQLAFFNLFGPSTQLWFAVGKGLSAHVAADVHLDFAAIRSQAYPAWVDAFGAEGTKSLLQLQGYYVGPGGSARVAGDVVYRGLRLEARAAHGIYRSADGWDREQSVTFHDTPNYDQISEFGATVALSPPSTSWEVRGAWDELRHASQMGSFATTLRDWRWATSVRVSF